jgi:Holliday junction DNA helicase RuvB
MHEHLDFYSVEELAQIVSVNAKKLDMPLSPPAAQELARRSRGTPRIANSRLHWVRSYHAGHPEIADGPVTDAIAKAALDMQEVDREGLDKQDRKYLEVLIEVFGGGPTGGEAIGATMNIASDTLVDEVEPYLLREQYIVRSPRGRIATTKAFALLGKVPPKPKTDGAGLFE